MTNESRPAQAAPEVPTTATSIALIGEISRQIGYETAMFAIMSAGRQMSAEAARTIWAHPRIAELAKRREVDHQPCSRRCRRCSKCVHSISWWSRGGRDYLGQEAERALAAS